MNTRKALFPISADPIHYGHVGIIKAAIKTRLFDELHVGIAKNPDKKYLFTAEERILLAQQALQQEQLTKHVNVVSLEGLTAHYAVRQGIRFIVKGCRTAEDYTYELPQAAFHNTYSIQTIILPADTDKQHISSSSIKAIVSEGGILQGQTPLIVKQALEEKILGVTLVGVTGMMGTGKSTFCQELQRYGQQRGITINHYSIDQAVHQLYQETTKTSTLFKEQLQQHFGREIITPQGVDKKTLAEQIFTHKEQRTTLAELLRIPLRTKIEETMRRTPGILLLDAAYLAEYPMLPLVNNHAILLSCEEQERIRRIQQRDKLTLSEITRRTLAQYDMQEKRRTIQQHQNQQHYGTLLDVSTDKPINYEEVLNYLTNLSPLGP